MTDLQLWTDHFRCSLSWSLVLLQRVFDSAHQGPLTQTILILHLGSANMFVWPNHSFQWMLTSNFTVTAVRTAALIMLFELIAPVFKNFWAMKLVTSYWTAGLVLNITVARVTFVLKPPASVKISMSELQPSLKRSQKSVWHALILSVPQRMNSQDKFCTSSLHQQTKHGEAILHVWCEYWGSVSSIWYKLFCGCQSVFTTTPKVIKSVESWLSLWGKWVIAAADSNRTNRV